MGALIRARDARRRLISVSVFLAAVLVAGTALATTHWLRAPIHEGETITLLLLGSDEGPFRNSDPLRGRADVFALLAVSPERDRVTFVNFPRDSRVSVPGRGRTRINACLTSGPQGCVETMAVNWGVEIDHYIVTDFNGLRAAVNRFGGVEVNVDRPVFHGGTAVPQTGRQRITGEQALAFTRDRKNRPGGDFDRATAQAHLLMEAHRELWNDGSDPARIARTVAILQQTTASDISSSELLRLAFLAMSIEPDQVDQVTLDGGFINVDGASMIQLHDASNAIIRDVAANGRLSE